MIVEDMCASIIMNAILLCVLLVSLIGCGLGFSCFFVSSIVRFTTFENVSDCCCSICCCVWISLACSFCLSTVFLVGQPLYSVR